MPLPSQRFTGPAIPAALDDLTYNQWYKRFLAQYVDRGQLVTYENYLFAFEKIEKNMPSCRKMSDFNRRKIEDCRTRLIQRGIYNTRINYFFRVFRQLCKWIEEVYKIPCPDPTSGMKRLIEPKNDPVTIPPDKVAKMIRVTEPNSLERLFLLLLFTTGLRGGEIASLRWEQFDFHEGILRLNSNNINKTKTGRVMPLRADVLTCAFSVRRVSNVREHVFAIWAGTHWPLYKHMLKKWWAIRRAAGFTKADVPGMHHGRHTFATEVHRAGADLRTLQSLLGHASIRSTMKYISPQEGEAVRKMINNLPSYT